MGQSLVKNYVHIVFSTKYRQPFIQPPWEAELHQYMAGICQQSDCIPVKIGGYVDHVHILCHLSKKIALMDLLEEVKKHSSKWMKMQDPSLANFYWQKGYGAFSVDYKRLDKVIQYIDNQHIHHQKQSFQEEYRLILERYGVEYDERYVWD